MRAGRKGSTWQLARASFRLAHILAAGVQDVCAAQHKLVGGRAVSGHVLAADERLQICQDPAGQVGVTLWCCGPSKRCPAGWEQPGELLANKSWPRCACRRQAPGPQHSHDCLRSDPAERHVPDHHLTCPPRPAAPARGAAQPVPPPHRCSRGGRGPAAARLSGRPAGRRAGRPGGQMDPQMGCRRAGRRADRGPDEWADEGQAGRQAGRQKGG